jgi:hypothetical protein
VQLSAQFKQGENATSTGFTYPDSRAIVYPLVKDKTEATPSRQATTNIGTDQCTPLPTRAAAAAECLDSPAGHVPGP